MRRKIERLRRNWRAGPRIMATLLTSLVLAGSLFTTVLGNNIVTVTDSEGEGHTILTRSKAPEDAVRMAGAVAGVNDVVSVTEEDDSTSVLVRRAFPVQLNADGYVQRAQVVDGTVADLLSACDITLGGEDYVQPALDTPLKEGLSAAVYRVTYEEEALPRQEVSEGDAIAFFEEKATADPEFTYRLSNRDLYDVTYEHRLINGTVDSSEIVGLSTLILPREPGSTTFEPGIPCSRIEGYDDIEMDADGLPIGVERVMNSAVCTAYSASRGRGSSGLGLYNGTCAVNPNVIPYGTRMWITSSDQNFVYGWCIATDTGTAMMEGYVDIDLFFETNAECLRFGKRGLDVYIFPPAEEE